MYTFFSVFNWWNLGGGIFEILKCISRNCACISPTPPKKKKKKNSVTNLKQHLNKTVCKIIIIMCTIVVADITPLVTPMPSWNVWNSMHLARHNVCDCLYLLLMYCWLFSFEYYDKTYAILFMYITSWTKNYSFS